MMPDTDVDQIRNVVQQILNNDGDFLVGDVVLIAEIIDGETGEPNKLTLHNTDITIWKEIGLLQDRLFEIQKGHFELGVDDDA